MAPGGRLLLGDLVVPVDPADVVTEIDALTRSPISSPGARRPDALRARTWQDSDLAVISAVRAG